MLKAHALVVDDDPAWQEILTDILADAGLEVDMVATLDGALRAIPQQAHRVAVVDLSLSASNPHNQDGLQVLEAIRRQDPRCTAVLLTGYATVGLAVKVLTDGLAATCLQKDRFSRHELLDLVRQALASPAAHPPAAVGMRPVGDPASGRGVRGPGRCLVVDDDAGWRSYLTELLEDAGWTVRAYHSYGDALGGLRRSTWHLAVIDLSLSGSPDGFRLLAEARAAHLPTVVVTGTTSVDDIDATYRDHQVATCLEKQAFDRNAFLRAVAEACPPTPDLSSREWEVLNLVREGLTNAQIAQRLFVSANTVKQHLKAIFEKLGVKTRAAAATRAGPRR